MAYYKLIFIKDSYPYEKGYTLRNNSTLTTKLFTKTSYPYTLTVPGGHGVPDVIYTEKENYVLKEVPEEEVVEILKEEKQATIENRVSAVESDIRYIESEIQKGELTVMLEGIKKELKYLKTLID